MLAASIVEILVMYADFCISTYILLLLFNCAFSALTLLVGGRKGIRPVKTECWGAGMVICME